jgi:hypothetical protein
VPVATGLRKLTPFFPVEDQPIDLARERSSACFDSQREEFEVLTAVVERPLILTTKRILRL